MVTRVNRCDATSNSEVIAAPDEQSEATTDAILFDEKLAHDPGYQLYVQVELEKEREAKQLLTDEGGHILRKMLCSQLHSAHEAALSLVHRGACQDNTVEAARLLNAASRLMSVFQQGMLALHNLQPGNEQQITLQQVNVSGGNTVVAANIRTGAPAPSGAVEEK